MTLVGLQTRDLDRSASRDDVCYCIYIDRLTKVCGKLLCHIPLIMLFVREKMSLKTLITSSYRLYLVFIVFEECATAQMASQLSPKEGRKLGI